MARSMVLGNGNTLICLDEYGQVRDFYFPYVGQENHIGQNQVHKIGVFVDGSIHWVGDGSWASSIMYKDRSMVSQLNLSNNDLGININSEDIVYNEKNILLRKFTIKNNSDRKRPIKIFFNQQFKISDTNHADTAYFSSLIESVIHYKGRRVFLTGGLCDGKAFDDYSIGFNAVLGKEGTWKDAEDGKLSQNSIEHGQVDSVVSWERFFEKGESKVIYYWIMVGETYREVQGLRETILQKGPEHILESTGDFWHAWTSQVEIATSNISPRALNLFYDSLLVMKTHTDNRGGILASGDSGNIQYGGDNYGYIWPRDACFVAWSFDLSGYNDVSKKFYDFANNILTDDGYVLHKYQPDRSLGSSWHPWVKRGKRQLAIQEDETAILLVGFWEHYIRHKDLEFMENLYNPFIKKAADFLIYFKDKNTNLPLSSYDLWEERYGVSVFTASVVFGGLMSAYNFAKVLGKEEDAELFLSEADKIRKAIMKNLWDDDKKYFWSLIEDENGLRKEFRVDVSNFYGPFRFGVLSPDDPRMHEAFKTVMSRLSNKSPFGGIARYEGDDYNRIGVSSVGNPWVITTLWLTQYKIAVAQNIEELRGALADIEWVASLPKSSMLPEQINPENGAFISATPLIWSHAEFVRTVLEYKQKFAKLRQDKNESRT